MNNFGVSMQNRNIQFAFFPSRLCYALHIEGKTIRHAQNKLADWQASSGLIRRKLTRRITAKDTQYTPNPLIVNDD